MKIIKAFALSAVLTTALEAHTVNEKKVINLSIANNGITRLSVQNQPIKEVFLFPDAAQAHITLHSSGQLFLVGASIPEPTFVSVITTKGITQDLKLSIAQKNPSPIELEVPTVKTKTTKETLRSWMEDVYKGFVPVGLTVQSPHEGTRTNVAYKSHPVKSVANEDVCLTVFHIQNITEEVIEVDPKGFTRPMEAIYAPSLKIQAGHTIHVVIAKRKETNS